MLFNSWQFLYFFPIVTVIYFLLSPKARWVWLLAASCFFYMSFVPIYILILGITIVIDYSAGLWMERTTGGLRRGILIGSIISTCLVLFIFKYYNFFNTNFAALASMLHWNYSIPALKLLLPIGLSFHTFQSMSYVIEVYRGEQKAEHHFGIYALYVMFYPQLVAGPIERPQNLLHQFHEVHPFNYRNAVDGLILMAWGLFKKVVIADRLAVSVSAVFDNPTHATPANMVLATVMFAFQVYCDFSGYSEIAIGSAKVMGFSLMQNFNHPYGATSISDFWKRWHISLSTWLRDYVYTPLAIETRQWGIAGILFSLMVTFFISGLWHGASWTFVIWGLLHGVALSTEVMFSKTKKKLVRRAGARLIGVVGWLFTFSYICFTYIFFRAASIGIAFYMVESIFLGGRHFYQNYVLATIENSKFIWARAGDFLGQRCEQFMIAVLAIALMEFMHSIERGKTVERRIASAPGVARWIFYYAFMFGLIKYGVWFQPRSFIYFQF